MKNSIVVFIFLLMLLFPTTGMLLKAVLIFPFLLFAFTLGVNNKILDVTIGLFLMFYMLVGVLFSLEGLYFNAPGAVKVLTVMVLWPIVFTILGTCFRKKEQFNLLLIAFIVASYVLFLISVLIFYQSELGIENVLTFLFANDSVGYYASGLPKYANDSISSAVYMLPFFVGFFVYFKIQTVAFCKNYKVVYYNILGAMVPIFIVAVLSGRKALMLEFLLMLLIIPALVFYVKPAIRVRFLGKFIAFLSAFLVVLLIVAYMFPGFESSLSAYFIEGFDFTNAGNNDAYIRYLQFDSLMDGWRGHPLFGNGFGNHTNFIRDPNHPWAYELFYVAFLFWTGIVGVIAYGAGILWIIFQMIFIVKKENKTLYGGFVFSCLVAMILFLVANATNPYLGKFSYMWVIFLPVAIINYDRIYARRVL
jgi:hypothetical protein